MPKSIKSKTGQTQKKQVTVSKSTIVAPEKVVVKEVEKVIEVKPEVATTKDTVTTKEIMVTEKKFNWKKVLFWVAWVAIFVASIALVDFLVQYMNNDLSVAVVNGKRISKDLYYSRLEKLQGQTVSDQMIKEEIVSELAAKDKISVTEFETGVIVSYYINKLGSEKDLNDALTSKGWSMQDLKDDINRNLLEEKVATKDIAITDEELQTFFDQYKAQIYPNETDPVFSDKKEEVRVHYIGQKFQEIQSTWTTSYQSVYDSLNVKNNFSNKPK